MHRPGRPRPAATARHGGRRTRRGVAAALTLAFLATLAPAAGASSIDRGSTRQFITAASTAQAATVAAHSRSARSVDALIAHVMAGCPRAGVPGASPDTPAQARTRIALFSEATDDLALAEFAPIRSSLAAYAHRLAALRWTDPRIGRAIAVAVRQGRLTLALVQSDLCADFATATASGFVTIPADTYVFLRAADAALRATRSNTSLLKLMLAYTTADEAGATRRLARLQQRVHTVYGRIGDAGLHRLHSALYGP
jgi:hypothetical protein